jgi:hypothetical protein
MAASENAFRLPEYYYRCCARTVAHRQTKATLFAKETTAEPSRSCTERKPVVKKSIYSKP